jgi:superfamily I DNA/RNA helicase
LKLYELPKDDLAKLQDKTWKPKLSLSDEEREIVETKGTVCVLGRSGTGKTVCICNRIDHDRTRAPVSGFSQLFVARSQRLIRYVQEAVGIRGEVEGRRLDFMTFHQLLSKLERSLPRPDNDSSSDHGAAFLSSQKVDSHRFQRELYKSSQTTACNVDALIVWDHIHSFIKGSFHAVQQGCHLSREEYLGLGKKACRLEPEQRQVVYDAFERYENIRIELRLWDDCDRIASLIRRLQVLKSQDSFAFCKLCYNKIYVDEVQDYLQPEIALFYMLSGPGDLFLAGDTAQNVVEGVEFRFEDIRSVGYFLFGSERRHLIPEKPKIVSVNFRSHSGVLNVAAGLLDRLFSIFPDSAKQLKEDRGLFLGPRPGVFENVEASRLKELVERVKGLVFLTHDSQVAQWKRALGDYPLVYGIREAKGLEFQSVVIVDFFGAQPSVLQKAWRSVLLDRDTHNIRSSYPEIEGQLKLLYTAVTRCIASLFFAETSPTISSRAFVRWLLEKREDREALATKQNVHDVEKMKCTPDEWRSLGIDNAVLAESTDDPTSAVDSLDRALYCFEQLGDANLCEMARSNRESTRFRFKLESFDGKGDETLVRELEEEAARHLDSLLAERLLLEARKTCDLLLPHLSDYSRETLGKSLVSRLPSIQEMQDM